MNGKRAVINIITNIILQFTLIISGFIIPKLTLMYFGSSVNGMISSISQFIVYASLMELGIGNAATIALYKPIAENDSNMISNIVSSAKRYYLHAGLIYCLAILILAVLYPLLIKQQMDYLFVFLMVLCIGMTNAVDFLFIGKYKILLNADQKYYILSTTKIILTAILTIGSVWLLFAGVSVLFIKVYAIIIRLAEALIIWIYVHLNYGKINYHSKNYITFPQSKNVFVHQLCNVVTYNTDLIVLTIFLDKTSLLEISVYSVYYLAFSFITNIENVFTTGIAASFGQLWINDGLERTKYYWQLYEFGFIAISNFLSGCFSALILSFVACYTKGIFDVNYVRPIIGLLFAFCGISAMIKDAAGVIINAVGHYMQTQKYVIIEAVINISISLLLVKPMGISGVLIGTIISHIVATYGFMYYVAKHILPGTGRQTIRRTIRNVSIFILFSLLSKFFLPIVHNWTEWFIEAVGVCFVNAFFTTLINFIFERETLKNIKKIICLKIPFLNL